MSDPSAEEATSVSQGQTGRVTGLARRAKRRAPIETLASGEITEDAGLVGDSRGIKYPRRRITVMAEEDWREAIDSIGAGGLGWTTRRANILVRGVRLPRAKGALIGIGDIVLEVTGQTVPCARMDEALDGLRKALAPEWRGGVTCAVVTGGTIAQGDTVTVLHAPAERRIRLPG